MYHIALWLSLYSHLGKTNFRMYSVNYVKMTMEACPRCTVKTMSSLGTGEDREGCRLMYAGKNVVLGDSLEGSVLKILACYWGKIPIK